MAKSVSKGVHSKERWVHCVKNLEEKKELNAFLLEKNASSLKTGKILIKKTQFYVFFFLIVIVAEMRLITVRKSVKL